MEDASVSSYDGFLSYSHAADDLLAPRLQAGLQRFAKPWWKRRALHIFRDEASLSANPHLWSSITDALDDSEWFVLLLSPEAAHSEWVNREIEYWLDRKDRRRILPVVTDGEFGWCDGEVTGDAIPPSLKGVFEDEPRWGDLRFARTETQLDLRHARFRDAVADIAAAIRGVPKDELESEEIHQHRRTIRTAWTAGVMMLVLGIAATVSAVAAYSAQQEAAERAASAAAATAEAERQKQIAEQETKRAQEHADIAQSRLLVNSAMNVLDDDPELCMLLALEAGTVTRQSVESTAALRQALAISRVSARFPAGSDIGFVSYSPDGANLATGLAADVGIWDIKAAKNRILSSPQGMEATWAEFSPDGAQLAVSYAIATEIGLCTESYLPGSEVSGRPRPDWQQCPPVIMWDVAAGNALMAFQGPGVVRDGSLAFSPDGESLAAESTNGSLVVWNTETGKERYRVGDSGERWVGGPSFGADGSYLSVSASDPDGAGPPLVMLLDASTGVELQSFEVPCSLPRRTAIDPNGLYVAAISDAAGVALVWSIEDGELLSTLETSVESVALAWSPDGETLAVAGRDGLPRLHQVGTWQERLALVGQTSAVKGLDFSPDGDHLAGRGSDILIWDVTPSGSGEVAAFAVPSSGLVEVASDLNGESVVAVFEGANGSIQRLDAENGQVLDTIPDQMVDWPVGPIIAPEAGIVAGLSSGGNASLYDLETFSFLSSAPTGGYVQAISGDGTRAVIDPLEGQSLDKDGPFRTVVDVASWNPVSPLYIDGTHSSLSPDGTILAHYSDNRFAGDSVPRTWFALMEVIDGSTLAWFEIPEVPVHIDPEWNRLAIRTPDGRIRLLDVGMLRGEADVTDATTLEFAAHIGAIADARFSPDGSLLATWGVIDERLKVWDTTDGSLVADLGTTSATFQKFAFHPDGQHLVANDADTTLTVFTLDDDELIEIARSRLTRSFTDEECGTFYIDPCPDLETIRGG